MQRAYFKTFMIILVCLIMSISSVALAVPSTAKADTALAQTSPYAVSSGAVNVRGGPGTGFWILGNLYLNEIVPILYVSPDYGWWYVSASFGEGWVSTISVTAYNTDNVMVYDPGPIGTITAGVLNVRYGPGPNATSLGKVGKNDQVYILAQNANGSWYQIRWTYGVGWVNSSYVATTAAAVVPVDGQGGFAGDAVGEAAAVEGDSVPAVDGQGGFAEDDNVIPLTGDTPYAVVTATYLNVRSGPGPNYSILGQVYGNQTLPIIGRNTDSSWYQVSTIYGPGWVYAAYVVTRNEYGATGVTSNLLGDAEVVGPIGIANTGALFVRSGPGPQYTSLGAIPGGTEGQILGRNADWTWWLMDTIYGPGWVYSTYILVRGDPSTVAYVDPGAALPAALPSTTTGTETGSEEGIDTGLLDGQGGFDDSAADTDTVPVPVLAYPVAIVTTGALHIRTGPNSSFPSLGIVYGGTRMDILGQSVDHGWWYVDSPVGLGYVSKLYILTDGDTSDVPVVQ
ncbi:MAG: SH3 domain-containing protein [Anaerolineae bacterium]|nr:SH3 domain-containing protein [Anaerolineae bacterium]